MNLPVSAAGFLVTDLVKAIVAERDHLSEIDGAIGDGDHGVNMAKGFNLCAQALGSPTPGLKDSLGILGNTLMAGIGGSMGPLYGTFFNEMADSLEGTTDLDAAAFGRMIRAGLDGCARHRRRQARRQDVAGHPGAGGGGLRGGHVSRQALPGRSQ